MPTGQESRCAIRAGLLTMPAWVMFPLSLCLRRALRRSRAPSVGELDVATVAEAIPHIVWMADSSGSGDYLDSRALDLTGLTPEALSGSGWLDAVHPGDRELAGAEWADAVASGQPYLAEYRVRDRDGLYRRMQARALPIRAASGEVVRWIGTWTDVEDDRLVGDQLESSRRQVSEALALVGRIRSLGPVGVRVH